jgi:hypothetical protein
MAKRKSLKGRGPTIDQMSEAAETLGLKLNIRLIPRPKVHYDDPEVSAPCQFCGKVERSACGVQIPEHHTASISEVTCRRCLRTVHA